SYSCGSLQRIRSEVIIAATEWMPLIQTANGCTSTIFPKKSVQRKRPDGHYALDQRLFVNI
ncbi:MAG: hypothetical protein PHU07_03420, partial [Acidocella sp.]|nr:hypothetical protein [Acidocella sp.]